jgi:hypothetical protein
MHKKKNTNPQKEIYESTKKSQYVGDETGKVARWGNQYWASASTDIWWWIILNAVSGGIVFAPIMYFLDYFLFDVRKNDETRP